MFAEKVVGFVFSAVVLIAVLPDLTKTKILCFAASKPEGWVQVMVAWPAFKGVAVKTGVPLLLGWVAWYKFGTLLVLKSIPVEAFV